MDSQMDYSMDSGGSSSSAANSWPKSLVDKIKGGARALKSRPALKSRSDDDLEQMRKSVNGQFPPSYLWVFVVFTIVLITVAFVMLANFNRNNPKDEYSKTKILLLSVYSLSGILWPIVLWAMLHLTGATFREKNLRVVFAVALLLPMCIFGVDALCTGLNNRSVDFGDADKRAIETRNTAGILVSATFALGTLLAILKDRRSVSSAYLGITALLLAIGIVLPNFERPGSDYDQMVVLGVQKSFLTFSISLFVTGILVEIS